MGVGVGVGVGMGFPAAYMLKASLKSSPLDPGVDKAGARDVSARAWRPGSLWHHSELGTPPES